MSWLWPGILPSPPIVLEGSVTRPGRLAAGGHHPAWSGGSRLAWFFLLLAVPVTILLLLVAHYGVDVPYIDQWTQAELFVKWAEHRLSFADLLTQQNESRLLFPNLIFLGLAACDHHWNVVREMMFEVGLVGLTAWHLWDFLRLSGLSRREQITLQLALTVLLYSLLQQENWLFGIQVCYYLVPLALCTALRVNLSSWSPVAKSLVSAFCAFVAAYSFSGGIIIWIFTFPGWAELAGSNRFSTPWWRRLAGRPADLLYAGLVGGFLWFYLRDYRQPNWAPPLSYPFTHPGRSLAYLLVWCGTPLWWRQPAVFAVVVGGIILGLFVWQVITWWRRLRSTAFPAELGRRIYPWLVLGFFAAATGLLSTAARVGLQDDFAGNARTPRYTTFSNYLYFAVIVLTVLAEHVEAGRFDPHRPRRQRTLAGLAAAAIVLFLAAQPGKLRVMEKERRTRENGRQSLTFFGWVPGNPDLFTTLTPYNPWLFKDPIYRLLRQPMPVDDAESPETAPASEKDRATEGEAQAVIDRVRNEIVRPLLGSGFLRVPQPSAALRTQLERADPTVARTSPNGGLESVVSADPGQLVYRGWSRVPVNSGGNHVILTCSRPGGLPDQPVAVASGPQGRPNWWELLAGSPRQDRHEFTGTVATDSLSPGDHLVTAWLVHLGRSQHAEQLGAPVQVRLEPRPTTATRVNDGHARPHEARPFSPPGGAGG